jgi:hypothetical protein
MEENPFLMCGSFFGRVVFPSEEKLKEERMEKSKTKTKKESNGDD